ncbi:hypothetical protein VPH35_008894 [Triticum aestivum]
MICWYGICHAELVFGPFRMLYYVELRNGLMPISSFLLCTFTYVDRGSGMKNTISCPLQLYARLMGRQGVVTSYNWLRFWPFAPIKQVIRPVMFDHPSED